MKFRIIAVLVFLNISSASVYAAEKSLTEDRNIKTVTLDPKELEGKLKAGVVLGYPWGITTGYRFSNFFELNGTIGNDYYDFTTGVSGLFTILDLKISHEIFPLSIGPAIYTHFGHDDNDKHDGHDEYTKVDLLGVARFEYSFKQIPLNLFIEAGFGIQLVKFADTAGSFAVGIRYIF